MAVPGTVYAYKKQTKISSEYTTIKHWLRGLLNHFSHKVTHTKINGTHVIKKRWLRCILSHFAHKVTHAKISDEYIIKVNGSVYIASRTDQFCRQYAIISV